VRTGSHFKLHFRANQYIVLRAGDFEPEVAIARYRDQSSQCCTCRCRGVQFELYVIDKYWNNVVVSAFVILCLGFHGNLHSVRVIEC
jgi:hypothetical protein